MIMVLVVALTGSSLVAAAGTGELKIQSGASVQKVYASEIHQIGVEPIPATGQITIEDLLAVQGSETEDPRAAEKLACRPEIPPCWQQYPFRKCWKYQRIPCGLG